MNSLDTGRFSFISDALNGVGVFRPQVIVDVDGNPTRVDYTTTCLVRYPRESDDKFARRNQVAWYENHLLSACSRFVGYIAKKPPLRVLSNPGFQAIEDDANWRGDSLDVFWQSFMVDLKARGSMLLLVDMPRSVPADAETQYETRSFPYLVPIFPESVNKYHIDRSGMLEMVEITDIGEDGKRVIRGWNREEWYIREAEKIIDQGAHGLGACPVLAISEGANFGDFGPFSQIADMSKRLFNARSELDEILRAQTFSILAYQVQPDQAASFDAKAIAETIGTHNMLIHQGDAPQFIAPSDSPAMVYIDVIGRIESAINRVSLSSDTPEKRASESGLALNIRFQVLNSSLTSFARKMEDLERRMWWIASRWMRLTDLSAAQIEWPKDFAISDTKGELEVLSALQSEGFPGSAIRLKKKQIASLEFATSDQDELDAIIEDINNEEIASASTGQQNG